HFHYVLCLSEAKGMDIKMDKRMSNDSRSNNINMLRFVGAVMVIAGHMGNILGTEVPTFLGVGIHAMGVRIFFLLGGFLITQSWLSDPNPARYMVKRVFRIFPALVVFVIVAAYIVGPLCTIMSPKEYFSDPGVAVFAIKNIFLYPYYSLPGVFTDLPYPYVVNGSLWTLPVEFAMYLMVPIIAVLIGLKKKDKKSFILLSILAVIAYLISIRIQYGDEWHCVVYGTDIGQAFALIPYYLVGMLFVFPCMRKLLNIQIATLAVLLYSCLKYEGGIVNEILIFVIFSYLIFSLAFATPPYFVNRFRKCEVSYGIYLYGFMIQQVVVYVCKLQDIVLSFSAYLFVSLTATSLISVISYKMVEESIQKISKRILKKI
ncbi:MAG: acyltransferase, partial [Oscillospiraceae bacterium]|nr:acyltransferase [Oscillospiraceae bacterium]